MSWWNFVRWMPPLSLLVVPVAFAGGPSGSSSAEGGWPGPEALRGVVVRVVDLETSLEFYESVAGFAPRTVDRDRGLATMRNGTVDLWLVDVETRRDDAGPESARAHVNVQVESLGRSLEALGARAEDGVRALQDEPQQAVIGPNMPIVDPSGNILHLVELFAHEGALERPTIFNSSLVVSDMASARAFYEKVLGFDVYSEDYYPPVIPYLPAGAMQVVLHEGATSPPSPPEATRAQVNLLFAVDDPAAARRHLEAAGRSAWTIEGTALEGSVAFTDPLGNVHVVVASDDDAHQDADPQDAAPGDLSPQGGR